MRDADLAGDPHALQVHVDGLVPLRLAHLPARCEGVEAGIGDNDIDGSEFLPCPVGQRLHLLQLCHVHLRRDHLAAHLLDFACKRGELFRSCQWIGNGFVLAACIADKQACPFERKRQRMSAPHAVSRARDENNFILESLLRLTSRHRRFRRW